MNAAQKLKNKQRIEKILERIKKVKRFQKLYDDLANECRKEGISSNWQNCLSFDEEIDDLRIELCKLRGE